MPIHFKTMLSHKAFWCLAVLCLLIWGAFQAIENLQRPFAPADIPRWEVHEDKDGLWNLAAVDDPQRKTQAWLSPNPQGWQCDTVIILGGLEEGKNLAMGGQHLPQHANIVALRHPLYQMFVQSTWKQWNWWEWLVMPFRLKTEMAHTLGALQALADYVNGSKRPDARFTKNVILAGGSFGGPFPVILTSFAPQDYSALMVIYGFTNYELVITSELTRQGLIHFKLPPNVEATPDWGVKAKILGVRLLGQSLGFLLGNAFKYGYMEAYFPKIRGLPIFFINGEQDHLVPREAYQPMWESAHEPKFQVWAIGGHIQPGKPAEVRALVDEMHRWAEQQKLWQCQKPFTTAP